MRLGSLCSGAGMLDCAVEQVLGAKTVWHCELETLTDKDGKVRHNAATDVLAARWPGIPNHGDLTAVDWDAVEPIDVMTAGYPCQPFSHAGQRKGTDDERHIWPDVREAIRRLRPRITLLENVAGHRSMGFDRVLGDLAEDGMHVRWTSLRASDVGPAHARERLWIVVTPDAKGDGWPWVDGGPGGGAACGGRQWQPPRSVRRASVSNASRVRRDEGWTEPEGLFGRLDAPLGGAEDVALLPTPTAARSGRNRSASPGAAVRPSLDMIGTLLPTPTSRDYKGHNQRRDDTCLAGALLPTPKASDASGGKHNSEGHADSLPGSVRLFPTPRKSDGDGGANPLSREERMDDVETRLLRLGGEWGEYEPGVRRWESLTRPAPSPTEPNTKGNPRLNPAFSEWLMGWPPGWVTEVPGISRNDQLRIIGNGVVPQCAAAALSWLLSLEVAA